VDGVRYVGRVTDRDEAFREYDDALEAGHGGFLLDEERADVFTASLGNVKPGAEVVLSITYVTELAAEGSAARFTLPTTVSPRYAPASDRAGVGQTPADLLNPPVALDVSYGFAFEMDVAMTGQIRTVQSPTHPIEVAQDGSRAHVRLAQRQAPMDRDLVVVVAADGLDVPHALVERGDRGGAVLLSFLPRFDSARQPAEVIFVIDRSGSMGGASIAEVRNALQLCLRSLTPGCRFNIVSFGSQFSPLFRESRLYDEGSMDEAAAFVSPLEADLGGTEVLPALAFVLQQAAVPGLPRQVLLLTDGQVTNTDEVIGLVRRHAATARFFTFGIGAGASHHLVRGIARASGGAAEFISPGERIEAKVMRQFSRVLAPALTDIAVDWGQLQATPASRDLPAVFDGERVSIYALADAPTAATATLTGNLAGRPVQFEVVVDPAHALSGDTIATLAARARIRTLEEQGEYLESRGSRQRRGRVNANVAVEIAALGVKYQLCTRETSFVAIEHRETPSLQPAELRRVPVALTSGWGGDRQADPGSPSMAMASLAFPSRGHVPMAWDRADIRYSVAPAAERRVARRDSPPAFVDRSAACDRDPRLRTLDRLVALQAADGSWNLTPELADIIGQPFTELEAAVGAVAGQGEVVRRSLATGLALAWLAHHAPDAADEWDMLYQKGRSWLAAHGTPGNGASWLDLGARLLKG
jgi:Ca-activated chloride channel family protein